MTFQEYINQEDPQRQHYFTVRIDKADCEMIYKTYDRWIVALRIHDKLYNYIYHKGGLYTITDNGERGNATVFTFKGNIYE